jgi:hypothetical protein
MKCTAGDADIADAAAGGSGAEFVTRTTKVVTVTRNS